MKTKWRLREIDVDYLNVQGLAGEHCCPQRAPTYSMGGPPIVFCHGMWCHGNMFHNTMMDLAEMGHETYSFSYRGHGGSHRTEDLGNISVDDYVNDLAKIVDYIDRPLILAGHSMGGIVAQTYAQKMCSSGGTSPVVGVILLQCGPPAGVIAGLNAIVKLGTYLNRILGKEPVSLTFDHARDLLFNTFGDDQAMRWIYELQPESGRTLLESLTFKYSFHALNCPTLVMKGTKDKICPRQTHIARILKADLVSIPTSHMSMLDPHQRTLVEAMNTWLLRKFSGISKPVPSQVLS